MTTAAPARPPLRARIPLVPGWMATLSWLCVAVTVLLVVTPLLLVLLDVFSVDGAFSLQALRGTLAQTDVAGLLLRTLAVVLLSTTIAVVVAASFALLNERTDAGVSWLTRVLPIVPLLVPPVAGAIGWVLLAAPRAGYLNVVLRGVASWAGVELQQGPLDVFSWYGLVFVYALYLIPHAYLTIAAGLQNVDPALEEAARVSGAGPLRTVWRVTLPSVRPSVASGALQALIIGFALFSVPAIIGQQAQIEVLSVRIVNLMTSSFPPRLGPAVILGLLVAVVVGLGWWLQMRALRAGRHAQIGGRGGKVSLIQLGAWRRPVRLTMVTYLVLTSVLPFLALAAVSVQPFWSSTIDFGNLVLRNYADILVGGSFSTRGLRNSVLLGITGATTGMFVAAVIGRAIQHATPRWLGRTIDGITKLPGVVTNLVIGIAFVAALAGPPFGLHGTLLILFLAYLVLYLPQATFNANVALAQVGDELPDAARMSGAGPGRTFLGVTLPLMSPGLVAGWSMLFVLMAGDITASSMIAGTRNPVVGFVVLDLFVNGSYPDLAALAVLISILSSGVVLSVLAFGRRLRRRYGWAA